MEIHQRLCYLLTNIYICDGLSEFTEIKEYCNFDCFNDKVACVRYIHHK
jgi:hypothetical protein